MGMNFSTKHKIIWWAPERCATKLVADIFSNYDFKYKENIKSEPKELTSPYHSHAIFVPEEFNDFKIVCSIRNPYDRALSLFTNFTSIGSQIVYTKTTKQIFIDRFSEFVIQLLRYSEVRKLDSDPEKNTVLKNYVAKYDFDDRIPDYFIRMEHLKEDLSKLDFIAESPLWKSDFFDGFISNNPFMNLKPYSFDDIYTFESAQIVFNYFKKHFFLCNYDPFSFTKESLTEEQRKKFLHEIIQNP
jgi:hypothetical protein